MREGTKAGASGASLLKLSNNSVFTHSSGWAPGAGSWGKWFRGCPCGGCPLEVTAHVSRGTGLCKPESLPE